MALSPSMTRRRWTLKSAKPAASARSSGRRSFMMMHWQAVEDHGGAIQAYPAFMRDDMAEQLCSVQRQQDCHMKLVSAWYSCILHVHLQLTRRKLMPRGGDH